MEFTLQHPWTLTRVLTTSWENKVGSPTIKHVKCKTIKLKKKKKHKIELHLTSTKRLHIYVQTNDEFSIKIKKKCCCETPPNTSCYKHRKISHCGIFQIFVQPCLQSYYCVKMGILFSSHKI